MAIVQIRRPTALSRTEQYAKTASTVYAAKTLVSPNENKTANVFDVSTASSESILGVIVGPIAATDGDYASETKVPILIDEFADYQFAVGTGTADVNDEQDYIDLKDADEVDVTTTPVVDTVFVTNFISGTSVGGKITSWTTWNPPQMRA